MFCWELGGGLGHLMQMLPLAGDLVRLGHRVFVALRDLDRAGSMYARSGVCFLQAPVWLSGAVRFPRPVAYAQLLANVGFGSFPALFARACAWRNLMAMVRPDLIVFDHSPTALLASRGLPNVPRRALIGSGFCCPPDDEPVGGQRSTPWAVLRPEAAAGSHEQVAVLAHEAEVLEVCNRLLAKWDRPPLDRLGQLYSAVDENFLTTLPELDHFPNRRGAGYWGPIVAEAPAGEPPAWPSGHGKRVLVYLKHPVAIEAALGSLRERELPTVAFADGASAELRGRLQSPTLRFASRLLDVRRAAAECDLAILEGGHGATTEVLLAGKPVLELPSALEQRMVASAVVRIGAGQMARRGEAAEVSAAMDKLLTCEEYANAARRFARRYAAFRPERQRCAILKRCSELPGARIRDAVFA